MPFPCISNCGLCCQSLNKSPLLKDLDRGDGTCTNYDSQTKRCRIYVERPLLCNVDKAYEQYYFKNISRTDYYRQNLEICLGMAKSYQKQELAEEIEKAIALLT